jgi:hypothetical protein
VIRVAVRVVLAIGVRIASGYAYSCCVCDQLRSRWLQSAGVLNMQPIALLMCGGWLHEVSEKTLNAAQYALHVCLCRYPMTYHCHVIALQVTALRCWRVVVRASASPQTAACGVVLHVKLCLWCIVTSSAVCY